MQSSTYPLQMRQYIEHLRFFPHRNRNIVAIFYANKTALFFYILLNVAEIDQVRLAYADKIVAFQYLIELFQGPGYKDFFPGGQYEPCIIAICFASQNIVDLHHHYPFLSKCRLSADPLHS